jgi:flagellar protein FliJ
MTLHQDQPGRVRAVREKRRSIAERRREKEAAAAHLEAERIRTMIERFEMDIFGLDKIIKAELKSAAVSDPSHFAFPISLRMMMAQRENLAATAAMLNERLEIVARIGSRAA